MASVDADSLVKSFSQIRMRPEHLSEMSTQLDLCQKALSQVPRGETFDACRVFTLSATTTCLRFWDRLRTLR